MSANRVQKPAPAEATTFNDPTNTFNEPTNVAILAVSEDRLEGYQTDPFGEAATQSGVEVDVVIDRVRAMLRTGTIRRVRQTLLATSLAQGALVAWQVPPEHLDAAFDYLFEQDPFSGHVVVRSADADMPGSGYRLWTTLKVPQGYSMTKHCDFLAAQTGAEHYRLMPARCLFVLDVGHIRRRGLAIGSKADAPAEVQDTRIVEPSELDWRVLTTLKREFAPDEIRHNLWRGRAAEAGLGLDTFHAAARSLDRRGVIGRFFTFLEHVKPASGGERVTRDNALFHWAVPPGREIEAGQATPQQVSSTQRRGVA